MKKVSTYLAAGLIFGAMGIGSLVGNYTLEAKRSDDIKSKYTKQDTIYLSFLKNNYSEIDNSNNNKSASFQIPFKNIAENYCKIMTGDPLTTKVQNEFEKIKRKFPEFTMQEQVALETKVELNKKYNDELSTLKVTTALMLFLSFISINMYGTEIQRKERYGTSNEYIDLFR